MVQRALVPNKLNAERPTSNPPSPRLRRGRRRTSNLYTDGQVCCTLADMKHFQLFGLLGCFVILVGCETTQTAGQGNQERKRLAAIEQEQAEATHIDESTANLL